MAKRFGYGKMQGTATRLLDRFQQGVVTLVRPGEMQPGPDEFTPGEMGEPTIYTLKAAVAAVTVDQANAHFIDGTLIIASDLVVTCAAPPVAPEMTDMISIDGSPKAIKAIIQLPAAGVAVAYKLIVES